MRSTLFLLLSLLSFSANAQNDPLERTIVRFFDALSQRDTAGLKETVTADFHLLEVGEVWNTDSLIRRIARNLTLADFRRENRFQFYRKERSGKMAWISYDNVAVIGARGQTRTLHWLESAVLVKERGRWKIRMLHSTRIAETRTGG